MATKKKGCGFLIIALIILLIGGGIATFLGMGAVESSKKFADSLNNEGKVFVTPIPGIYTAEEDSEVTIWYTSNETSPDLGGIEIEVTEKGSGNTNTIAKPKGSSNMGNQYLVGAFKVEKGKDYLVNAKGVPAGETFRISSISSSVVLSVLGKGFGAIGVLGGFGLVALIFGIIGIVKLTSSNKTATPPAA